MTLLLVAAAFLAALNIVRIVVLSEILATPIDMVGLLLNIAVVVLTPMFLWWTRRDWQ